MRFGASFFPVHFRCVDSNSIRVVDNRSTRFVQSFLLLSVAWKCQCFQLIREEMIGLVRNSRSSERICSNVLNLLTGIDANSWHVILLAQWETEFINFRSTPLNGSEKLPEKRLDLCQLAWSLSVCVTIRNWYCFYVVEDFEAILINRFKFFNHRICLRWKSSLNALENPSSDWLVHHARS